jgi:hypothetical protein
MEGTVIAAFVTGVLAVTGALVTVVLTKRGERERDREADRQNREREYLADWRKLKLEAYKEYFTAISDALVHEKNETARARYLSAVNMLNLVASPNVLEAFNPYQIASTEFRATPSPASKQTEAVNSLANTFFRSMREDCHPPGSTKDGPNYRFQLFVLPPDMSVGGAEKIPPPQN